LAAIDVLAGLAAIWGVEWQKDEFDAHHILLSAFFSSEPVTSCRFHPKLTKTLELSASYQLAT
jgi:hypothetical protein